MESSEEDLYWINSRYRLDVLQYIFNEIVWKKNAFFIARDKPESNNRRIMNIEP
jgi:hypothetical protein